MKRLLLVRHGESHWNVEGRIQGQLCSGLSDRGRAQAEALATAYTDELRALLDADPRAVRVVTSDLRRARQTAAPLAAALGLEATPDARLRERAFGSWEGRSHAELAVEEPQRWERWTAGADVMREIGAETAAELAARVAPALLAWHDAVPAGGCCVVISHGGSIWHGLHRLLSLPPRSLGPVGNAAVAELLLLTSDDTGRQAPPVRAAAGAAAAEQDVHPVLASFNGVGHLPPALRSGGFARAAGSDAVPQMR